MWELSQHLLQHCSYIKTRINKWPDICGPLYKRRNYEHSQNFLWGGATAANQYEGGFDEGGKGLTVTDSLTNGTHTSPRRICKTEEDGRYYR